MAFELDKIQIATYLVYADNNFNPLGCMLNNLK